MDVEKTIEFILQQQAQFSISVVSKRQAPWLDHEAFA
jgi:hypothetical protein